MKKNSDSDYKAEDEGSATDTKAKIKPIKKGPSQKHNKKEMIENTIKSLLPEGVTLTHVQPLTKLQYQYLLELKDAPEFSLNYKTFYAKISRVVDGDTFKGIVLLNEVYNKFTFRLNGIDAPETRKGEAKEFGKKVKEIVTGMLENKIARIEAGDFDKYGRILCRVYIECEGKEICVNDFLIENEMAKAYYGKTKVEFTDEDYEIFEEKYENKQWPKTSSCAFQQ